MSENVQPPWLQPQGQRKGNPAWYPGCKSPNPSGRPPGIVDKRMKVTKALDDDGLQVARVVIDAALAGESWACGLVLQRIAPPIKARTEKVAFTYDPEAPLKDQARQVMSAVAAGEVDPDTGKMLLDCLSTVHGIAQVDEFAARLAELEAMLKRE